MASDTPDNVSDTLQTQQAGTVPKMEGSAGSPFARTQAKSVQSVPEAVDLNTLPLSIPKDGEQQTERDLFERRGSSDSGSDDEGQEGEEASSLARSIQEQPEELPIELISLTDR